MNKTPLASRFTIGIFGRRNMGKSSLLNALTGQNAALVSPVAGTTTDPVYKTMEILPIGPVVFIDTAGIDDEGELGALRIEKTYQALRKCDFAVLVSDAAGPHDALVHDFAKRLKRANIPGVLVLNKCDIKRPDEKTIKSLESSAGLPVVCVSVAEKTGIAELINIIKEASQNEAEPSLIDGLISAGDTAVLVTPIDSGAPKGRLILPQQQTIRDILDAGAFAVVTKEDGIYKVLKGLKEPPKAVITDSQAFKKVAASVPESIPLTSFSILFARQKCGLEDMLEGIKRIESLKSGDRVLISEGCTHHRQGDDIGSVKIPKWIREMAGDEILFEHSSGGNYPKDLSKYALIVHCGGCMLNHREMKYRVEEARRAGTCITNYGVLIAHVAGILPRAVEPFI